MMFALVLGLMVGAAAVVLLEQWLRDGLGSGVLHGGRPIRVFTPTGSFIVRSHVRGEFERKRAA